MTTTVSLPVVRRVRRVRRVSSEQHVPQRAPEQGDYRGFGSVRVETLDEFHDRMFEVDPLEAVMYEMELALDATH